MAVASKNRKRAQEASDSEEDNARDEGQQGAAAELKDPRKTLQHLFLQSLISRRCVKLPMAKAIHAKCLELCGLDDSVSFERFISELEEPLSVIHLEIKTTRDQETGEAYIALINTVSDSVAKLATDYSAVEIAHFRAIIEAIMTAPDMAYCISMKDAVRCYKGEKRTEGQRVITSLLAKGWLSLHPSQHLTLSTRSLVELNSYLRDTFNPDDDDEDADPRHRAVVDCDSCLAMVTSGYACPNTDCAIRLHTYCAPHKLGASGKCPDHLNGKPDSCNQQWIPVAGQGKFVGTPVGVEAIGGDFSQDDDGLDTSPVKKKKSSAAKGKASQKGKKSKGRAAASDDEEEDELDDDEDDDMDESSAPAPKGRTSSRRRSSSAALKKLVDDEADGEDDEMYE